MEGQAKRSYKDFRVIHGLEKTYIFEHDANRSFTFHVFFSVAAFGDRLARNREILWICADYAIRCHRRKEGKRTHCEDYLRYVGVRREEKALIKAEDPSLRT